MEGKDKVVIDKQAYWDAMAELYDRSIQLTSYQPYITLVTQTQAHRCSKVLELAIGTGTHTLYFAKTLMKRGATVVCTEISLKMLEYASQKFNDPDNEFVTCTNNKAVFKLDESLLDGKERLNMDQLIAEHANDASNRLVFGCIANNECLPFKDDQFDCYLAPLSLMLVNDYKKQLHEAYRVTMPGAKLGFSVWGRRENILLYPLVETILERHGLGATSKPAKSNYDIAANREAIRQEMIEIGFSDVKMWFQPMNFTFNSFNDFFDTMFGQPTTAAKLQTLPHDKLELLMADAQQEYIDKIQNCVEPSHFENMIIIARKPETDASNKQLKYFLMQ